MPCKLSIPLVPFTPAGKCFAINVFNFSNASACSSASCENNPLSSLTIDSIADSNSWKLSMVSIIPPNTCSTSSDDASVCITTPWCLDSSG